MKNYPNFNKEIVNEMKELRKSIPETMQGFGILHQSAMAEGSVSTKNKELIALGISIHIQCEGCVSFHLKAALEAGATKEELTETVGVAILMGGGPAMVFGGEVLAAIP